MTLIKEYLPTYLGNKKSLIDEWFKTKTYQPHKLLYSSVDIRYSGQKLACVDANIFPAGFNNLSVEASKYAGQILSEYLGKNYYNIKKVIIIAESHTRNQFYIDNLLSIEKLFLNLDIEVILATLESEELIAESTTGKEIKLFPLAKYSNYSSKETLIILNNDLTSGAPEFLTKSDIKILPPFKTGWFARKKTKHFEFYKEIIDEFCKEFSLDSFYLSTAFGNCTNINFKTMEGLECVAKKVDEMLHKLRAQYRDYGIKQDPYLVVKSNSGTYGMAIMVVSSGEEIIAINKKGRNKMNSGKSGAVTDNVIIQEGIETIESYQGYVAESMVYSVAAKPISLIYRYNKEKNSKANLNSTGMSFKEKDFAELNSGFYYHYLVTKLTNLAILKEIEYYGDDSGNKIGKE